jgi:RNA polymerase sigma factor (sigma-70 family)
VITSDEDVALLAAVRGGSERAFNLLIDRHQRAVRLFLRGVTTPADAEDAAQETFLAAWTHAGSFKGLASVRSWLLSIAWRKAKGMQRWSFRGKRRDSAYFDEAISNPTESGDPADRLALGQALAQLPTDQRAAVMLCLGCGLSHGEAAEVLDMPLGTVKSHVLRGRARLREFLGES